MHTIISKINTKSRITHKPIEKMCIIKKKKSLINSEADKMGEMVFKDLEVFF